MERAHRKGRDGPREAPGRGVVWIEPARESGIAGNALKAFFGMRSAIRPVKSDLSGTDTLVIASPVWLGRCPRS